MAPPQCPGWSLRHSVADEGVTLVVLRHRIYYSPALDRVGQRTLEWVIDRHNAERVLGWYRQAGYPVHHVSDVDGLPEAVVEERVSRLREYWRRWLFGESAAAMVAGPAGLLIGGPFLSMVLMGWAVEMGFAYGQDMTDVMNIDDLRRTVHGRLMKALGLPVSRRHDLTRWRRLIGTMLFWGFGPELNAADAVMAEIRRDMRRQWETRHARFTATPMRFASRS